jgi:peptide chain release factor 3
VDTVAEEVREELELLDAVGADIDLAAFAAGTATPVFFGSALSNFGVRLLLDAVVAYAPAALGPSGCCGAGPPR